MIFVGLGNPVSVDVFENSVYWTSKLDGALYRFDKFGRGVKKLLRQGFRNPTGVKTFHPAKYDTEGNFFFFLISVLYLNCWSIPVVIKN